MSKYSVTEKCFLQNALRLPGDIVEGDFKKVPPYLKPIVEAAAPVSVTELSTPDEVPQVGVSDINADGAIQLESEVQESEKAEDVEHQEAKPAKRGRKPKGE